MLLPLFTPNITRKSLSPPGLEQGVRQSYSLNQLEPRLGCILGEMTTRIANKNQEVAYLAMHAGTWF